MQPTFGFLVMMIMMDLSYIHPKILINLPNSNDNYSHKFQKRIQTKHT